MANELIKKNFKDIADSIRAKTGKNGTMTPEEMPGEIEVGLAKKPEGSLSITENGTSIDVSEKATVDVNVPGYPEPTGTKNITTNGTHDVKDFASADVNVPIPPDYVKPYGTRYITENGTGINVTTYQYVDVSISPALPQYLIDLGSNEFIRDRFSTYNCTALVNEDDIDISIASDGLSLSEVNEDCSNLYSIVYSYFDNNPNITLPLILLDDSGSIDVECPLDTATWPWWEEKSEVLREALNSLSFYASDLLNYNLGTVWFHQSGGS